MKARFLEKFIMMEFVKGNLDSQEQVNEMITLIQKKLGISVENAGDFFKKSGWIDLTIAICFLHIKGLRL